MHEDAVAYIDEAPSKWANPTDCGAFPCTAPDNILLKFESNSFDGNPKPVQTSSSFQIVSYNTDAANAMSDCEPRSNWNGQICTNRNLGILLFESLDGDRFDRSVQPIYITNKLTGFKNTLNSFMDHIWDGFYTG